MLTLTNTLIIVFTCLVLKFVFTKKYEYYYDIVPYSNHWDMFKCYNKRCLLNQGYKCYKMCKNIENIGAQNNCRMRCFDYTDQHNTNLRFNDYNFGKFRKNPGSFSLLNKNRIH